MEQFIHFPMDTEPQHLDTIIDEFAERNALEDIEREDLRRYIWANHEETQS